MRGDGGAFSGEDDGDHRHGDQRRRQLHDAEQECREREQTGAGNALDHERDADQQHLDERDADHALRDGSNGGRAQLGDLRTPLRPGMREKMRTALRLPLSPKAMKMPAMISAAMNIKKADADAGDRSQQGPGCTP